MLSYLYFAVQNTKMEDLYLFNNNFVFISDELFGLSLLLSITLNIVVQVVQKSLFILKIE